MLQNEFIYFNFCARIHAIKTFWREVKIVIKVRERQIVLSFKKGNSIVPYFVAWAYNILFMVFYSNK